VQASTQILRSAEQAITIRHLRASKKQAARSLSEIPDEENRRQGILEEVSGAAILQFLFLINPVINATSWPSRRRNLQEVARRGTEDCDRCLDVFPSIRYFPRRRTHMRPNQPKAGEEKSRSTYVGAAWSARRGPARKGQRLIGRWDVRVQGGKEKESAQDQRYCTRFDSEAL
jgi:hypothetical protein